MTEKQMFCSDKKKFEPGLEKKKIVVLGSTGSIGVNTLDVIGRNREFYEVVGLAAGSNISLLARQIEQFQPKIVSIRTNEGHPEVFQELKNLHCQVVVGSEGLRQVASYPEADLIVSALAGSQGLLPTYEAVLAGKTIALANKETLVMAGELVLPKAQETGSRILPVDSEHSAIFQCLLGHNLQEVKRVLLTASGGPFFFTPKEEFSKITYHRALEHPTWRMGEKVSLDSATLMNKALEVIEAKWLFNLPVEKINIIVHPESIIHSMVEFCDGNILALLSKPDMRLPILYALSYPKRLPLDLHPLDLPSLKSLSFYHPDRQKFPCLQLGYRALEEGGTMPAVLNAANEVSLEAFKQGKIQFIDIPRLIEKTMDRHHPKPLKEVSDALWADQWAREQTWEIIGRFSC